MSFLLREELVKMERYQKQFHFLHDHGIETAEELQKYQSAKEEKINDLVERIKNLYKERDSKDEQGKEEIKNEISDINSVLKEFRADVRMCKAIFADAEKLEEKRRQMQTIQKQTVEKRKEVLKHEHKRRSR